MNESQLERNRSIMSRYSLKVKLIFSLSLILLILLIAMGVSQNAIKLLTHTVDALSSSSTASDWLGQAAVARMEALQNLWNVVALYDPVKANPAIDGVLQFLEAAGNNFAIDVKKFALEINLDASEKVHHDKLTKAWSDYSVLLHSFVDKIKKRSFTSKELLTKEASSLVDQSLVLSDILSDLSGLEQQKGTKAMHYANKLSKENEFLGLLIIVIALLTSVFSMGFSIQVSNTISKLSEKLLGGAEEVNSASKQVMGSSDSLAASVSEQAATLQEISSTVEELSTIVQKNAGNASKSQEISEMSAQTANRGKSAVEGTIHAIEEIDKSNQEITAEILNNNRDIANIVKVISEISEKTKVINDIAFQTKLLSFNASVEAARAGESGKGFAVVAEEVGNLAEISGNAAKEISDMLSESIKTVKDIAERTRAKIESLVQTNQEKVGQGVTVAKSCQDILNQVVNNVRQVDEMVKEVAVASTEQAKGILEISKAIAAMETVNQQNALSAQQTATASAQLTTQAENQKAEVYHLKVLAEGVSQLEGEEVPLAEGSGRYTKVGHAVSSPATGDSSATQKENVVA